MSHFLSPLIDNLQSIVEHGGYTIIFLITILEGLPVIGSIIPGHTAVILSGFLIKLGIFNWIAVSILVIIGAMVGDVIGYMLGKRYGFVFLEKFGKYFFVKPEHIEKAKEIVIRHTGKAIILGRFSPITRPLAPFVIGASKVHWARFWFYDFIGVLIWASGSIFLGYIFGASYHVAAGLLGKFIAIALFIAILIIWGYRFINKQFHIFAKYELIVLFFNLFGLYAFFKTIQDALKDKGFMANLDVWVNIFFSSNITSHGLTFINIVTDILSPSFLLFVTLLGVIYFLIKKQWRYATISLLATGGGLIIVAFVKEVVTRARPLGTFLLETDFSFPSGHTVAATIFFTLLIYFFARKIKHVVWRELYIAGCVLLIVLAGVSRLYLGVHWLSDVVAGCALGIFWTTLIILLVRYVGIIIQAFKDKRGN